MKAINLNKYEYRDHDHRTRKAYRHLIDIRNKLIFNQISIIEALDQVERIVFNEIPVNDLIYFKKEPTYKIFKLLISSEYSDAAGYQLKTDLLTVY